MPVRTAYAGAAVAGEVLTAANVKKMPGGWIGYAEITADVVGFTVTPTDIAGLAVTVTVETGRRIRVTGDVYMSNATASQTNIININEGATVLQQRGAAHLSTSVGIHAEVILTPTAGSHTYKLQAFTSAGAGTIKGNATYPCHIFVEDLGPAS